MLTGIQNVQYPSGTLMYSIHGNPSGLFKYCTWNRKDLKQKRHSLVLPRLQPIEGRHSLKPLVHPCEGRHHWGGPRERPSDVLVDRFYGVLPKQMCLCSTYCFALYFEFIKFTREIANCEALPASPKDTFLSTMRPSLSTTPIQPAA